MEVFVVTFIFCNSMIYYSIVMNIQNLYYVNQNLLANPAFT